MAPRNVIPRHTKSADRSDAQVSWDFNYITNIDVTTASDDGEAGGSVMEERLLGYDIYNTRPVAVVHPRKEDDEDEEDNEAVYGVVPLPNNNVKIVLRKPEEEQEKKNVDRRVDGMQRKHGSIVHINSQKHSVPYCCTGRDFRSNEIRIVVNHRWVGREQKEEEEVKDINEFHIELSFQEIA